MKKIFRILTCALVSVVALTSTVSAQQKNELESLNWLAAPAIGDIASKATIKVTGKQGFLGAPDTKRFLRMNGNPEVDNHFTLADGDMGWFAVFNFVSSGYIKDDEKIDAPALMETLKESNKASIEERKKQGLQVLYLDGWYSMPHYDPDSHNLEWGVKYHTDNNTQVINYTSRILGRTGYMSSILVSNPENIDRDIRSYKAALKGYQFNTGERYSEFKEGDKMAEYGLGALILGGAAAVAAKKGWLAIVGGFLAAAWKWVIGIIAIALYRFKSIFTKKKE